MTNDSAGQECRLPSTSAAVSYTLDGQAAATLAAYSASESAATLDPFQLGYSLLDAVHSSTGLPWWASIPLTSLAVRACLLPLSLRNAKLIRTNLALWSESAHLAQQQAAKAAFVRQAAVAGSTSRSSSSDVSGIDASSSSSSNGRQASSIASTVDATSSSSSVETAETASSHLTQQFAGPYAEEAAAAAARRASHGQAGPRQAGTQQSAAANASQAPVSTATGLQAQLERLAEWHTRMRLYNELRDKCGVPKPYWILINQLSQGAVFLYTSMTIRRMAQMPWPGFTTEGALWFQDLTLPALVWSSWDMPMGHAGFILPAAVTAMMLTSIHIGFKASGAATRLPGVTDTALARFIRALPPFLYALTLASGVIKVQLPQAALLHWSASSGFTLGLQLALKRASVRSWLLGLPSPVSSTGGQMALLANGVATGPVDAMLVVRAQATDNAAVLVVMAAQQSARQRYWEALYCLDRAVQLDPDNTRAHYSVGQIYSLMRRWADAESAFARTVSLSHSSPEAKGQALYCQGTAVQSQGRLEEAVRLYRQALQLWQKQPVVWLALVNTYKEMGQADQAAAAVAEALKLDEQLAASGAGQLGLRPVLLELQRSIEQEQRREST